jgi:hypothetical protein
LLELDVDDVLITDPPKGTPEPGSTIIGVFMGILPCGRGTFAPHAGDHVLAYLSPLNDGNSAVLCCNVAACARQCETADSVDGCLKKCQSSAREACEAERAKRSIAGYLDVAPVDGQDIELAHAEDVSFSAKRSDLATVFEGGKACDAAIGDVHDILDGLDDGNMDRAPWQYSCSE